MPAAAPDVLLATKLEVPPPRPGLVRRPRLLQRLAPETGCETTLVCAPAGCGKTSLLADWARSGGRPVAWVSLDPGDNDPVRFWRYAAAALDRAGAAVAGRLAPLLCGPDPAAPETVVTALVDALAAGPGPDPVVLLLDDYHLIQAPPVHRGVTLLLDHPPPGLRLVLAGRADPPLPLARLRARGQLAELRAADLRFTPAEAADLLRGATGQTLPEQDVAALAARTEGWAAGLQLAGLSLRDHPDPARFVAGFSGSHRYVLDYLTQEVLDRQPEGVCTFLVETSVLERLCGPLCDAVCGRSDSQARLEQLERANLFLVPLDEVRGWWRYHQLFADLLRARLLRTDPERAAELRRAAAAWCEHRGLVDEAIRYMLDAGDPAGAAALIERHFDALLRRAEGATVDRWLAALPAELVGSRPRLLLAQAVWELLGGRVDQAEPLLDRAEAALAAGAEEPYEPPAGRPASRVANLPASIALARAELARRRGDADRIGAFAGQARAQLTEADRALRLQVDWDLAVADWFSGRLERAERALTGVVAGQRAAGEGYLAVRPACDLGRVRHAQGRLRAALATYEQALATTGDAGQRPPSAGPAQVGIAEVRYERGELAAAAEHAADGVRLCRQLTYTLPLLGGLAAMARVRHAQGDLPAAQAVLAEAERVVESSPAGVGLVDPVPPLRARLALARGEVADAARWTRARGLAPDDQPSYPCEPGYLVLARVLLAEGACDQALALLERLGGLAAAQGRTGSLIEVRVVQALALAAGGHETRALAALAEALCLAAPEGHTQVFLDDGPAVAALLDRLAEAVRRGRLAAGTSPPADWIRHLRGQFRLATPVAGLIEPLSDRELEVLGLLAAGRTNREIAGELVVALDTVKKHVSHVLGKLGAANRTQAVARARELRLLG